MSVRRSRIVAIGTAVAVMAGLGVPGPEPAAAATICNRYCDGRDAALAGGDRTPVRSTLYGRTFTLHVDDANSMGWSTIAGGRAGDETWLDRSFDGGRTWAGNSRLGDTVVPAGAT